MDRIIPAGGHIKQKSKISETSTCPMCAHKIKPQVLCEYQFFDEENRLYTSILYLCRNCFKTFVAQYKMDASKVSSGTMHSTLQYIGPNQFEPKVFDQKFEEVSPGFVKIYNQAYQADCLGLDEIAGIGYRKALEFLVKDYLIYKSPEKADEIKDKRLAKCIESITDEDIRITAEKCAWLGNDQTHYVQKHTEYDLEHLKKLLDAVILWISLKFTTEFARTIERR